jgi:hypothetical protein
MPARTRESLSPRKRHATEAEFRKSLPGDIGAIFNDAQSQNKPRDNCCKNLFGLFHTAVKMKGYGNMEDLFAETISDMLSRVLGEKKANELGDRVFKFMAAFIQMTHQRGVLHIFSAPIF